MIFTRNTITRFVPEFVNISDQKLTQAVNALGMEVESVTKYYIPNNCVIGQLLEFKPIEGTHLNLCKVKIDANTINQIICGASGLIANKKVIVALPGAKLPNGIEIAKREIKGFESNGMMCAYSELTGNSNVVADAEQDEIIMFDDGVVGSTDWPKLIGMDDTIYDITVPTNRNDENSYFVLCYEIANKLGLKFNYDLKAAAKDLPESSKAISIDTKICNFLCFMDFDLNAKLQARSEWNLKAILMNHGVKPINSLMDKLAYATLLTNCPTHTYDADKLQGNMQCKLAVNDSKFIALNGKTYTLSNKDIAIYDDNQPVSIACVIGSENTKMLPTTKKVRVEIGNFAYANVRNTTIRLNADTSASKRASRPLSNYMQLVMVQIVRKLLGFPTKTILYYEPSWSDEPINLSYEKLAWFINEPIERSFVTDSLKKLGFEPNWLTKSKFNAPKWRLDCSNEEDLFEEILKIIDINRLKPISIEDKLLPLANNTEYELKQKIKDILINNYFSEVKTYNLTNKENLNKFNLFNAQSPIKIQCNNANREYFRLSLIDNMLKVFKYNDARKLDLVPIFEIQKLFTNESKCTNLTCLCFDKYVVDSISQSTIATNVNYFKSILAQIAKILNTSFTYKVSSVIDFYSNEQLAIIANNQIIGYVGKIRNSLLKDYDLQNKQVYCLSVNIDRLIKEYKALNFQVKSFGVFQRLSKDINITLDASNAANIINKVNEIKNIENIEDAKIINIFNKDNKIIYTVRYYLVDTKKFNTADLDAISKQVERLTSL